MSENSDAVVIIVSEETGVISVAIDGSLKRGFTRRSLEEYLKANLEDESPVDVIRSKTKQLIKKGGSEDGQQSKPKRK